MALITTTARAIITLPTQIKLGDIIEIRALIQHPMETGYRRSNEGAMLKRNLIRQFSAAFESGKTKLVTPFFSANLHAAISANPYLAFSLKVLEGGTLICTWQGDDGFSQIERRSLSAT